jgi:hypothetical protein
MNIVGRLDYKQCAFQVCHESGDGFSHAGSIWEASLEIPCFVLASDDSLSVKTLISGQLYGARPADLLKADRSFIMHGSSHRGGLARR